MITCKNYDDLHILNSCRVLYIKNGCNLFSAAFITSVDHICSEIKMHFKVIALVSVNSLQVLLLMDIL